MCCQREHNGCDSLGSCWFLFAISFSASVPVCLFACVWGSMQDLFLTAQGSLLECLGCWESSLGGPCAKARSFLLFYWPLCICSSEDRNIFGKLIISFVYSSVFIELGNNWETKLYNRKQNKNSNKSNLKGAEIDVCMVNWQDRSEMDYFEQIESIKILKFPFQLICHIFFLTQLFPLHGFLISLL